LLEELGAKIGKISQRNKTDRLISYFTFKVIVEEAAEILESHIVCSVTSKCEQLIMIG